MKQKLWKISRCASGSSNVGGGSTGNTGDINDIPDGGSTSGTGGGIPDYGGEDPTGNTDGGSGNGGSNSSSDCFRLVSIDSETGMIYEKLVGDCNDQTGQNKSTIAKKSTDLKKDECLYCPEVIDGGVGVNTDVDRLIVEQSFVDEECLYNAYKRMVKSSSSFNSILQSFDEDFSVADLIFTVDDNFSTNVDSDYHGAFAITKPPLANNKIKIVFNTDSSLDSDITKQPDVFKAVSLIHEAIHANMYRKMLDAVREADINQDNLSWRDWPNDTDFGDFIESLENKYEGIFKYYTKFDFDSSTPNNAQHQQMADYYRETIKNVLTDFDPSLTEEEKEALSWLGLNEANIVAWQNTPNQDEINQKIIDIKNTFQNGCN